MRRLKVLKNGQIYHIKLDNADYERVADKRVFISCKGIPKTYVGKTTAHLASYITGDSSPKTYVNGNPFDLRRENLATSTNWSRINLRHRKLVRSEEGNYYTLDVWKGDKKFTAKFDVADWEKIKDYRWRVQSDVTKGEDYAYLFALSREERLGMHRLLGGLPGKSKMVVDHINHDSLDNRSRNLRICTTTENTYNTRKPKNASTSKYKGVSKDGKFWKAGLRRSSRDNSVNRYTKHFKSEHHAALYYNEVATQEFGEYATLNEVPLRFHEGYEEARARLPNKPISVSSKYLGVSWVKRDSVWRTYIRLNGRSIYLGSFNCELEAAEAYNDYIIKNELNKTLNNLT